MTHELKTIVQHYEKRPSEGEKTVLATVVALDGSSYRRPGVRMLIFENGDMVGAVSGGCVEKEVLRQAQSVFGTNTSRIMVYDGRYRLGCEGVLYILLEIFNPSKIFLSRFWDTVKKRLSFPIRSFYEKNQSDGQDYLTCFHFEDGPLPVNQNAVNTEKELAVFEQEMRPCFQLVIIGAEHDAVQLCKYASATGWEVTIVANPREEKTARDFPGIHKIITVEPEAFQLNLDKETAVVVMTHSFVKDLQFLIALKQEVGAYIGLLGPLKRREKLFDELLERHPDTSEEFIEQIHGPAGIDIGAETPQEIAISILSEILAVVNKKEPLLLRHKMGSIHS
ncbi:XdhC family protein [Flagellimonas pacifica]|uniref:Xanthine and CO dehydrogenase maturation factor, XdhC/CoxF family n=1 Tax=Flagellimonas pacifica TaxID=1247520 RepID=A0A285MRU2_9FLAO|nr:XdhC/CoxI family protein [Allomuricauda parva]SNY99909.1 Xanthine and CO dehydrogenase maturation factor, XdhC/CoxF family [Allomuricauda parva]